HLGCCFDIASESCFYVPSIDGSFVTKERSYGPKEAGIVRNGKGCYQPSRFDEGCACRPGSQRPHSTKWRRSGGDGAPRQAGRHEEIVKEKRRQKERRRRA